MPPKTMPMPAQQAPVQEIQSQAPNIEYMLPHQREQYRKHLQTMNDLQGRKTKEPNNAQLDAAIAEARSQLAQLAQAAAQNERQYPTPELWQQYTAQYNQNLQQRRAEITSGGATGGGTTAEQLRTLQQAVNRMKDIEALLNKPELPEDTKTQLRAEYQRNMLKFEHLREAIRSNQAAAGAIRSVAASQSQGSEDSGTTVPSSSQPATPSLSQAQPLTPTIRTAPAATQLPIQQASSTPTLPPAASMGQLPRPSVNTSVPPARPTLTGGYPVGTPVLGTAPPTGIPQAFHLAQDGDARLLSKRRLQDLVKSIDPDERLEPDVEELLMEVADEFIDSVLQQSCKIARHRKGQMLEVRDVQLHLERNWNIRIPGYSSEEVRNVKKYNPTPGHVAKVGAISQAKAMTKD